MNDTQRARAGAFILGLALFVCICVNYGLAKTRDVASIPVVWKVASFPLKQIVPSKDGRVLLLAGEGKVEARDSLTGGERWSSLAFSAPAAASQACFVVTSSDRRLNCLNPRTGARVWQSLPMAALPKSVGTGGGLVLADVPTAANDDVIALSEKDGRTRWVYEGEPTETARSFGVVEDLVVSGFEDTSEPPIDTVDALDSRTGVRKMVVRHAYLAQIDGARIWLAAADFPETHPLAIFDLYGSEGNALSTYSYAPEPQRNGADMTSMNRYPLYAQPTATVLTGSSVLLDVHGRLYKYDRKSNPNNQTPTTVDVAGAMVGSIGEAPVVVNGNLATLLRWNRDATYRRINIQLPEFVSKTPFQIASTTAATFLESNGTVDGLLEISASGNVYFTHCANRVSVATVDASLVALCDTHLMRTMVVP